MVHDYTQQQASAIKRLNSNEGNDWPFLNYVCAQQYLPYIDYALAEQLLKNYLPVPESVACFICHLSLASRQGHLCVRIQDDKIEPDPVEIWQTPDELPWDRETLQKLGTLIREGAQLLPDKLYVASESHPQSPICKDLTRFYFQKYWDYETEFLRLFRSMLSSSPSYAYDMDAVQELADQLVQDKKLLLEQSKAIIQACKHRLTLVCGGPGTGKTYTTAYIIQTLWLGLTPEHRETFEILLAAPTGKAASQLQKSLTKVLETLQGIPPLTAKTLHSILDINRPHNSSSKTSAYLSADLIVVDESSMIDIKLMVKLLSSIKPGARLILLGDPFQLPSVEAGGVFSDMISFLHRHLDIPSKPIVLTQCLRAELKGILSLAEAVNTGNSAAIQEMMNSARTSPGIRFLSLNISETKKSLQSIKESACAYYDIEHNPARTPEDMLSIFNRFKILTPLRKGPFGVDSLNRLIYQNLQKQTLEQIPYLTPIMIINNHKGLNLFNGETGILVTKCKSVNPLSFQCGDYALFMDPQGTSWKTIPAALLPRFELAYCLSIHKSQGSEFDHVLLILPPGAEIFGRKAMYTGITRAKKQLDILSNPLIMHETIDRCSERISGVLDRS
jgi:exodeoxyribonuclease V alpha subunit